MCNNYQLSTVILKENKLTKPRLNWVDQAKGYAVIMVVYIHNFPFLQKYISNIGIPLFFLIAGFFFPQKLDNAAIKKKAKGILIPYFFWATVLFSIWLLVSSKIGESVKLNLSPFNNFLGIFYAQGDVYYMDWGLPLWFLPTIFSSFLLFYTIQKYLSTITQKLIVTTILITLGFLFKYHSPTFRLPWSIDIACVSLFFYTLGYYIFPYINKTTNKQAFLLFILFFSLHLFGYWQNVRVSFVRANYGNYFWMLWNGTFSSLYIVFFFKAISQFKLLEVIGKFSLLSLALHTLMLQAIKFFYLYVLHSNIEFNEWQKLLHTALQIAMIYPIFLLINKYFPILNGGYKKI